LNESFVVEGAGFGCLMMRTEIFDRVKKPYFKIIKKEDEIVYGEDLYFCKKAKMKMICDPGLVCSHVDKVEFNLNHYIAANGLAIENNSIVVTDEQKKEIEKKHYN